MVVKATYAAVEQAGNRAWLGFVSIARRYPAPPPGWGTGPGTDSTAPTPVPCPQMGTRKDEGRNVNTERVLPPDTYFSTYPSTSSGDAHRHVFTCRLLFQHTDGSDIYLLLANDDMLRLAIHRKTSVVVVRNKCDRYFSQGVLPRAPHFLMSTAQSAQKGQPNELHP
jgi:hypothetical protein